MTIMGPAVHKGLSVFFLYDPSREGSVPLTLQEAMARGTVTIEETRDINELVLENRGEEGVFVQAGDVVKGGWQDRVLAVSMLVPARSGKVPVASFCVESGRWARRAMEDPSRFSESSISYSPSRAKLAMMDMASSYDERARSYRSPRRSSSQGDVWESVSDTQTKLERKLARRVRSAASPSSLQLSMENEEVKAAREEYVAALEKAGLEKPGITGVVFAINGRVHSAERYPWSGLFAKMWPKNLAARVTEAMAEEPEGDGPAPAPAVAAAAEKFLAEADEGQTKVHALPAGTLAERRSPAALVQEARDAAGEWVHRTYLPAA